MLEVKIDTRLKVDIGGVHRALKIKNNQAITEVVDNTIRIVRKETPVGPSGGMQESVRRLDERGVDGNDGSTEKFIRIGHIIYYAPFVIKGTRPSQGKYVPELEVRIGSGQHPGIKKNPILVRAKKRAEPVIRAILKKHYGTFELGRFIR